ncbi:hypothetical protein GCM10009797_38930 [Nocardioides hwasunensis]
MTSTWAMAASSAREHRADLAGTGLVLAAAGAVVSLTGVLMESGIRASAEHPGAGMLTALASSFAGTALVVVLMVVTSAVALTLRQRRREIALLRTVGATAEQVRQLVSREVALLAVVAVPVGAVPALGGAHLLTPLLVDAGMVAQGFPLTVSPLPVLVAVAGLVPAALLAGRLATRESLRAAPAETVGLSAIEDHRIGDVRRISAVALAVGGLSAALSPVLVPGTIGAASAASSALLLVGAAACAGPAVVHTVFGRAAALARPGGRPSTRLALTNVHGFSRRLTAVVVPLAAVVAVGTMSSSVDQAMERAAHRQLSDAVGADLVAVPTTTVERADLDRLADDPSVAAVAPLGSLAAQVRSDPDLPDALAWETAGLRVVDPATASDVLDPDVTSGELAALATPGSVALGTDAAFELGASVGDRVAMRVDGQELQATVVALHDRGLGLGQYLVGPATTAAAGAGAPVDTVLVQSRDGRAGEARAAAERDLGASTVVRPAPDWVASTTSPDAAGQRLSSVLLLALLLFVGLGAANAMALSTRNRRDELSVLARTGATRRQLLLMVLSEAVVTAGLAWILGTLAVLPAVLAVTAAMLGAAVPAIPLATYAGLSLAVFLVAVVASLAAAVAITRRAVGTARTRGTPGLAVAH